jgi:hypothetical protein
MDQQQQQIKVTPNQPSPQLDYYRGGLRLRFVDPEDDRVLFENPRFESLVDVESWLLVFVRDVRAQIRNARECMTGAAAAATESELEV